MLAGIVTGASLVIAALMLLRIAAAAAGRNRHFLGFSVIALGIAAVVATIVPTAGDRTRSTDRISTASGLSMTDLVRVSAQLRQPERLARQPERLARQPEQVASVPSLIDGLRLRLEAEPDNARGWALLAQSYAFVGDADGAEQAIVHAVALGFDEADLRQRVASAQRDPHAGLPGLARAR